MIRNETRLPTYEEIDTAIAAGRRERTAMYVALGRSVAALVRDGAKAVWRHFALREDMRRAALKERCADCAC